MSDNRTKREHQHAREVKQTTRQWWTTCQERQDREVERYQDERQSA